MATKNHFLADHTAPGENLNSPTRAGKPAAPTYSPPGEYYRGSKINRRRDAQGLEQPDTLYGENSGLTPASVGVADANRLAAVQATPEDPIREQIVRQGTGPESVNPQQQRHLEARNVDEHPFMKSRDAGGVNAFRDASLPTKLGNNQSEPVRKPGR
jgi:hypothetical protein